ncbi:HPr kinase/phosphorylase [Sphingomonas sp. CJ20]
MALLRTPTLSTETVQAVCVAIDGRGVLIEGRSSEARVDLALLLLDRGAMLVSGERTLCERKTKALRASAPPGSAGKIEVRGLGVLSMPHVADAPLDLVVVLLDTPPRFPEDVRYRNIAGIDVPVLALGAQDFAAPVKVALALRKKLR